jgi:hypothetical protein
MPMYAGQHTSMHSSMLMSQQHGFSAWDEEIASALLPLLDDEQVGSLQENIDLFNQVSKEEADRRVLSTLCGSMQLPWRRVLREQVTAVHSQIPPVSAQCQR